MVQLDDELLDAAAMLAEDVTAVITYDQRMASAAASIGGLIERLTM